MALVCSILWIERPSAAPLLAIPILVAFVGYRAYVTERQGHEKVKFLYEANRTLSESPEVAVALEGLLERALEAFRAEQAEIILFSSDGAAPLRTGLGPGSAREAMAPVDATDGAALRVAASAGRPSRYRAVPRAVAGYLEERGIRHGMLGVLRGEDRVIGVLLMANRYGLTRGFTDADRALFDTLAANASAALQFDRLEQAVTELRDLQDQLTHQANHDPLTGLANRALFSQRVREALEIGGVGQVAVMFIDLDDFKGVNDTLGHGVGDELLRGVASRLVRSVRKDDIVARLGGDEFAVLVQRESDVEAGAVELAERTLSAFLAPVAAGEKPLNVSPVDRHRRRRAPAHARRRAAARRRRGHVRGQGGRQAPLRGLHPGDARLDRPPPRPQGRAPARAAGARAARPVPADRRHLDRRDGLRRGAGALEPSGPRPHPAARVHPARRGHRPDRAARALRARGGVPERRRALRHAAGAGQPVRDRARASRSDPDHHRGACCAPASRRSGWSWRSPRRCWSRTPSAARATLQQLRDLGVQLALDDFGTGYSSLSYLRNLPLDTLKIAREFVEGLAFSDHDAAFVRLIVGLAKTVGLKVVAEGIETRAQLDMLREIGCDLGQGYYFAAPMDVDADWLSPAAAAVA